MLSLALSLFVFQSATANDWEKKLIEFANLNAGSHSTKELERNAEWIQKELKALGLESEWKFEQRALQTKTCEDPAKPLILLTGHFDTVFESFHPFQKAERSSEKHLFGPVITGPGVVDAKSGILLVLHLLSILKTPEWTNRLCARVFFQADEEISSRFSAEALRKAARGSQLILNFEPGWWEHGEARFITEVGGQGVWSLRIQRVESHLATSETLGQGAADDLIAAVSRILSRARARGIRANLFDLQSKTKSNVTSAEAFARVSFRYFSEADRQWLLQQIKKETAHKAAWGSEWEDKWLPHRFSNEPLLKLANQAAQRTKHPSFVPAKTLTRSASSFVADLSIPLVEGTGLFGRDYHSENEAVFWGSWELRRNWVIEFLTLWIESKA